MATITVNSTASLVTAIGAASGGDTIKLASGVYSDLNLKSTKVFDGDVTITSADPLKPAVLTDFTISGAHGLTFSNVELAAINRDVAFDDSRWAFSVFKSNDIHFDNVSIHGSLDDNSANDVSGLQIKWSSDVSVTNSQIQQVERGLLIAYTDGAKASGNYVHDIRSDGFDFADVRNVQVTGNNFRDFKPVGEDHPDAIQFWTKGTVNASHDILIANNVIMRGDSDYTHGIFFRDETEVMPYERVTITNNLIVGSGYHGISVSGMHDLEITDNNLVSFNGELMTWMKVASSDDVLISGNSARLISVVTSTNVVQKDNESTLAVSDHGAKAIETWLSENDVVGKMAGAQAGSVLAIARADAQADLATLKALQGNIDDYLVGGSDVNLLEGFGGNDTLDGGGGADTLAGGAGNDVYIVPNGKAFIFEKAGEGIDTVIARGEHTLADNVENLRITTADELNWKGTGNSLDNRITGNAGANLLDGVAGADTIIGGAGDDTVVGGAGDDWLTGGDGADRFRFLVGSGHDVITDLGAGSWVDNIDISAFIKAGLKPTVTDVGQDALISFTNGDSITVLGLHANDLGALSKTGWVI